MSLLNASRNMSFICVFSWRLIVALVVIFSVENQRTSASTTFSVLSEKLLTPGVPKRLADPGWQAVPSALACSLESVHIFPNSTGFLYNNVSGLCTPLKGLEGQSAPGAKPIQADEGKIYMNRAALCTGGNFKMYEIGPEVSLTCMQRSTYKAKYDDARADCEAWGGQLPSPRTVEMLSLVRKLADGSSSWVGFDDRMTEGTYIWHDTGEAFTTKELEDLFANGEPIGNGDCGSYWYNANGLDDENCNELKYFVCERKPAF